MSTHDPDGVLVHTVESPYQSGTTEIRVLVPDGQQEGEWKTYFVNGKLATTNYFVGGDLEGWQEYFTPLGHKEKELFYEFGFLNKAIQSFIG